ncbi:MAG: hypothetical protein U9O87_08290 [Verrucomicrobiota bacterium]|nr:hypothetical protein [Verrucomicrobiota bacterium]
MYSGNQREKNINSGEISIVIRTVGERTENLCRRLVSKEIPKEFIVTVREYPFGEAVRKTFEKGIEMGQKWTLALDSDVLLRANAIQEILNYAEYLESKTKEDIFFINFIVIDKLLGKARTAGVHLYKTNLFEKALLYATKDIDNHERPESFVRSKMAINGYPAYDIENLIVGLHDFEQFYFDIYRKAFTHRLKHSEELIHKTMQAWKRLAVTDRDFRVALAGAQAAEQSDLNAIIDKRLFPEHISEIDALSGLKEKENIEINNFGPGKISKLMGDFSPFLEFVEAKNMIANARGMLKIQAYQSFFKRLLKAYNNYGVSRLPFWLIAALLEAFRWRILKLLSMDNEI